MELMSVFNDSANRLTDYLTLKADGKTEVNLMDAFERVTLDVISLIFIVFELVILESSRKSHINSDFLKSPNFYKTSA